MMMDAVCANLQINNVVMITKEDSMLIVIQAYGAYVVNHKFC